MPSSARINNKVENKMTSIVYYTNIVPLTKLLYSTFLSFFLFDYFIVFKGNICMCVTDIRPSYLCTGEASLEARHKFISMFVSFAMKFYYY